MTCPHCGREAGSQQLPGTQTADGAAPRCPFCDKELAVVPSDISEKSPAPEPISVGMLMLGLVGYPIAWFILDVVLFFATGNAAGKLGTHIAVLLGVLLYVIATAATFKFGSKSVAIGALIGLAVPLLAFGACWNL